MDCVAILCCSCNDGRLNFLAWRLSSRSEPLLAATAASFIAGCSFREHGQHLNQDAQRSFISGLPSASPQELVDLTLTLYTNFSNCSVPKVQKRTSPAQRGHSQSKAFQAHGHLVACKRLQFRASAKPKESHETQRRQALIVAVATCLQSVAGRNANRSKHMSEHAEIQMMANRLVAVYHVRQGSTPVSLDGLRIFAPSSLGV